MKVKKKKFYAKVKVEIVLSRIKGEGLYKQISLLCFYNS